jgi:methylthioribose-1-phosphate isomerase
VPGGRDRPRLQGARLTAWELKRTAYRSGDADSAAGHFMRTLGLTCVGRLRPRGSERHTANKIRTYNLAVVAHENRCRSRCHSGTTIDMKCLTQIVRERPAGSDCR